MRHTYSCLAIAIRHPRLFQRLAGQRRRCGRAAKALAWAALATAAGCGGGESPEATAEAEAYCEARNLELPRHCNPDLSRLVCIAHGHVCTLQIDSEGI